MKKNTVHGTYSEAGEPPITSKTQNHITGQDVIKWSDLVNFFPRQKEALNATKKFKYVLYGGSVGSGKSYFLRWAMIYWLCRFYHKYDLKGVRVGLFCEDYPALNDRHLSKVRSEFPEWLGTFNEQRHEFTLAPEYGGGILAFRNLDDPSRYLSVEFAAIAIDEVNRNPLPTFTLLRTRLRWSGITETKFIGACNPVGELWVKNYWVKRLFPPEEREPQEFYFVNALPTDNPHLPQEYFESLKSLPEAERKAYLEGSWDSFSDRMDSEGWIKLLTDSELNACKIPVSPHSGVIVLGVDPAAGGDKSTIVVKSGNAQEIVFNQKLKDVMDLVGVIADLYRKYGASMVVVDKGGIGQGVFDRLREMDIPTKGISFAEKPEDPKFRNIKAELYWREREWLLSGGRLMENHGWNEFDNIKYKNKEGKITIQPKEELFRLGLSSPDCVDAAVLTHVISDRTIKTTRMLKRRGGVFYDRTIEIWRGN